MIEIFIGAVLAVIGAAVVTVSVVGQRRSRGALAFLTDADDYPDAALAAYVEPEEEMPSIVERVMRPLIGGTIKRVRALYPTSYLDGIHRRILHAGLANAIRAEEFATLQVVAVGVSLLLGVGLIVGGGHSKAIGFLLAVFLVGFAAMAPSSWLSRRVRARTSSIERELPDVLDLLTIAVESGLGLEQAMEQATADFDSPMSSELARTLQEMSLGLSRHQALQNLKARSACEDLASFVLVLSQADALGMPIGRVLRTQSDEMRERRRARAKEKAGKLPVKILFPLMFFILPPLMIVVMGPAANQAIKAMKYLK
jgi:tight adherence protein C